MFADQLREITKTQNPEMIAQFEAQVTGHPEEKMLRGCLAEAIYGRQKLGLCRGCLMPKSLMDEGLQAVIDGSRLACSWE